jgi:hypothetical protein
MNVEQWFAAVTRTVMGASEALRVLASSPNTRLSVLPLDDILNLADARLELEYLAITRDHTDQAPLDHDAWDLRWISADPGLHFVLADGQDGAVVDYRSDATHIYVVSGDVAASLRSAFQEWWKFGRENPHVKAGSQPTLLHADIGQPTAGLVALTDAWRELQRGWHGIRRTFIHLRRDSSRSLSQNFYCGMDSMCS